MRRVSLKEAFTKSFINLLECLIHQVDLFKRLLYSNSLKNKVVLNSLKLASYFQILHSNSGVLLGQNCVRLLDAALDVFFFFKKKKIVSIGVAQIRGALLQFFTGKKCLFYLFWTLTLISKITPATIIH